MAKKKESKIKGLEDFEDDELDEEYEDLEDDNEEDEEEEKKEKKKTKSKKTKSKTRTKKKKNKKSKENDEELEKEYNPITRKIINIIFVVVIVLASLISIDFIMVKKFNIGPFFAIKYKTRNDGGTKEYIGLGYKVINYNVFEGRKGYSIGSWKLEYNTIPTEIDILDIAIEFENDKQKTANKLYNKYVQLKGKIISLDTDKHNITIQYNDESNKYTLDVEANLTQEVIISKYKVNDEVYISGIPRKFIAKTDSTNNKIVMNDCFMK